MAFNFKKLIGDVAPWLTAAIPIPALQGIALSAIKGALNLPPETKPEAVQQMIAEGKMTADQLAALKAADEKFQLDMQALKLDSLQKLEALAADDRDSARKREIAVRDNTPKILAYLVITLTALGEGYLLVHGLPPNVDPSLVGRIQGSLDAASMLVLGYYFGSSIGSDAKTALLAQAPSITDKP